jgi:hypothetical protein
MSDKSKKPKTNKKARIFTTKTPLNLEGELADKVVLIRVAGENLRSGPTYVYQESLPDLDTDFGEIASEIIKDNPSISSVNDLNVVAVVNEDESMRAVNELFGKLGLGGGKKSKKSKKSKKTNKKSHKKSKKTKKSRKHRK